MSRTSMFSVGFSWTPGTSIETANICLASVQWTFEINRGRKFVAKRPLVF